jgi:protocatechuate 3,4-dioxygenase beta subunit
MPGNDSRSAIDALNRRQLLGLGGLGAAALLAGCRPPRPGTTTTTSTPGPTTPGTCVLQREVTQGPYYLDRDLVRGDISGGRPGVPVQLDLLVADAACRPRPGAAVDVWYCDAGGTYSGVLGNTGTFLRGTQLADAEGRVSFQGIYPGWYTGRCVHFHVKVHVGGRDIHTGQLFIDQSLNDRIAAMTPYSSNRAGRVRNESDGIFRQTAGLSMLPLTAEGSGYRGAMTLAVQ